MKPVFYAIGDIHGRDDLLEKLYGQIEAFHKANYEEREGLLIHLGDYIDRGPKSCQVVDRAMKGIEGFKSIYLMGNHEAMMLSVLDRADGMNLMNWIVNGGDITLQSFGVSWESGAGLGALRETIGEERMEWFEELELYYKTDKHLFVHAGIKPGVSIEEQEASDLLWIREPFLYDDTDHGLMVVHGHTISEEPVIKSNRIGIDIGSFVYNRIAALVVDEEVEAPGEPKFLIAEEK